MNLTFGFNFIKEHHPWCCLVDQNNYWKVMLRQVVIRQLRDGKVSKSREEIRGREIQGRLIEIYKKYYGGLSSVNKKIEEFKMNINKKYEDSEIKDSF